MRIKDIEGKIENAYNEKIEVYTTSLATKESYNAIKEILLKDRKAITITPIIQVDKDGDWNISLKIKSKTKGMFK